VSHRVSGGAACPRRLYYTRYYTRPRLSAPAGWPGCPIRRGCAAWVVVLA